MTEKQRDTSALAYQSALMFSKYQKIYAKRGCGLFDNWGVVQFRGDRLVKVRPR